MQIPLETSRAAATARTWEYVIRREIPDISISVGENMHGPVLHFRSDTEEIAVVCQNTGCVLRGNLSQESKREGTSQRRTVGSAASSSSPHIGRLVHICRLIKISVHWDNHFRQGIIPAPAADYNVTLFPRKCSPQDVTAEVGREVGIVLPGLKMSADRARLGLWTATPKSSPCTR